MVWQFHQQEFLQPFSLVRPAHRVRDATGPLIWRLTHSNRQDFARRRFNLTAWTGTDILVAMNQESSEDHLHEIKNVLQDLVERWEVLADDEKKNLQNRAKKGLSHIDGIIGFVRQANHD